MIRPYKGRFRSNGPDTDTDPNATLHSKMLLAVQLTALRIVMRLSKIDRSIIQFVVSVSRADHADRAEASDCSL
jgi:hypothetical protein